MTADGSREVVVIAVLDGGVVEGRAADGSVIWTSTPEENDQRLVAERLNPDDPTEVIDESGTPA